MILLTLSLGFFVGVIWIVSLEILGFLFIIKRLNRKKIKDEEIKHASPEVHGDHLDLFSPTKQGPVWVLDIEKIPKNWTIDKGSREQKRKIEVLEVTPVRKYAILKDRLLLIKESNGSSTEIHLKDCTIAAVSATNLPSRKWSKKYPIKVESKTSAIYRASKSIYIYFETSVEKESWSKALRIASCNSIEQLKYFANLRMEFQNYLTSLNIEHPSLMKPVMGYSVESMDKSIKIDGSSSKVRHFLRKLSKKSFKSGVDSSSSVGREGKNVNDKLRVLQESVSAIGIGKPLPVGKVTNSVDDFETASITHSSSRDNLSVVSEEDSEDKLSIDDGTLCWNILLSRLFFDVKSNLLIKSFAQARIQRSLSNVRTPSYIGEVMCTGLHLGNLPPYIHSMRVLPSDVNDIIALEFDIDYCGGAVLDIETRVEVCDLDISENIASSLETTSVDEVASDLLEGIEHYGNQLKFSEETAENMEATNEENPKIGRIQSFKSSLQGSACASKWRSIINNVAKQVSQVPLSLGIKVASLRGTCRLQIKSPPSDQIWIAFTSMPDIDLNLESSVGEQKITSGHIALFLINRFKAAIRETMVLPNFENVYIPFMIAENDDWIPRQVAPYIWANHEVVSNFTTTHETSNPQQKEAAQLSGSRRDENKVEKAEGLPPQIKKSLSTSSALTHQTSHNKIPLQELKTPLLNKGEAEATPRLSKEEHKSRQEPTPRTKSPFRSVTFNDVSSRPAILTDEETHSMPVDEAKLKKLSSTRAKMLGLGKKMGDKLEERRRHIEEKGRNIVQKMRGHERKVSH